MLLLPLMPGTANALDEARVLAGIGKARAAHGVSGRGVIVAIIDRGLDHAHPGFLRKDGSSRILAMLDLTKD